MFREGLRSLVEKDKDLKVVGQAKDGEALLEILKKTRCEAVIVDLSMPNMDGIEAIRNIKITYPNVKILVLTMQKDHEHFRHAMLNGANGYLLKDDAFDQLSKAVKLIMRGKQFVSSSVSTLLTERFLRSLDDQESPSPDILTEREREILTLIANGLANKQIAVKLKLSVRTVETHRNNLTNKLGIHNTAGLVKFAISKGLV
jgi:DNA-binding NarL/FixJ family response regulator